MQWRSRHFLNDRFTQQKSLVAHQLDRPNRTWSDESVHRERSSKNIGDWKSVQFPKMSDGIFNILIPFGRNVFLETWIQAWFFVQPNADLSPELCHEQANRAAFDLTTWYLAKPNSLASTRFWLMQWKPASRFSFFHSSAQANYVVFNEWINIFCRVGQPMVLGVPLLDDLTDSKFLWACAGPQLEDFKMKNRSARKH